MDSLTCTASTTTGATNTVNDAKEVTEQHGDEVFRSQAFCLPASYSRQDRPNVFSSDVLKVKTGFIVDDVTDVNDDSCAVTMVLVMRFHWEEKRMVTSKHAYLIQAIIPSDRTKQTPP